MEVAYPWLNKLSCLQWTLDGLHMQQMSTFSAVRSSGVLFPNDFGEDLLKIFLLWWWQVLVRRNGFIKLYCKGADSTVYPCLHPSCQLL